MTADATFWDNIAEKYSRKPVGNPDAFERKISITKSWMKPTDVVIDLGCGTGSLALRLAPFGSHIHGLDISSEMVRIAKAKANAQGIANVSFHVGAFDESFTTFGAESFDGVCAYSLLHLVHDRADALARIYRLLKPGGYFISSTPCLAESKVPYRPILTLLRWIGKAPHAQVISKQTLEDEVRHAGFIDLSQPDVGADPTIAFMVACKSPARIRAS